MSRDAEWEEWGAASGLLATLAFVLAFVMFMMTDPTGSPAAPAVQNAQDAPAYLAANLSAFRLELLFTALGLAAFLWFLGSQWATLKAAEGDPGRGSTLAVVGAIVGAGLMLVGIGLGFTTALSASPAQAETVPAFYVAGALMFALGGGTLGIFFFGVAKVILHTSAMARWLGVLAFIVALLCMLAFLSPFFDSGLLDPATGIVGRWVWYAGFVVWVFLASLTMTIQERRLAKAAKGAAPAAQAEPQTSATEGEAR